MTKTVKRVRTAIAIAMPAGRKELLGWSLKRVSAVGNEVGAASDAVGGESGVITPILDVGGE